MVKPPIEKNMQGPSARGGAAPSNRGECVDAGNVVWRGAALARTHRTSRYFSRRVYGHKSF
jgi:hypothetical protein